MLNFIKENFKYVIILIVIIIIFLFGRSCGNKDVITIAPKDHITHYKDTIFPVDTTYLFKDKLVPYPVYLKDTTKYKPQPIDSLELYRFFSYKDSIEDQNVKIYSTITTQGKTLVNFKPSYKLKVPLIIKDCTVVKRDSFIYRPSKYELHVGVIAGFTIFAPKVELSIKRSTYSLGYDPFKKQPVIQYSYRIWGSKK